MKHRRALILLGGLVAISLPITLVGRDYLNQRAVSPIAIFPLSKQTPNPISPPETTSLTPDDVASIQQVIEQQIAAFQEDNAEMAFSFASPGIRERFQTADRFMNMVKSEYAAVYQPQSVNFEALEIVQGNPVQEVVILSSTGQWVSAYYQMERQADATWRIAGCALLPIEGETI